MKFEDLVARIEERRKRVRAASRPVRTWAARLAGLEIRRAHRPVGAQPARTVDFQLAGVDARSERSNRG